MSRSPAWAKPLLLLAAAIWGFAFVAQRAGMEHIGPFTFNSIRFIVGGLALTPFLRFASLAKGRSNVPESNAGAIRAGLLAGVVLFAGASLQQAGIVHTTAGKAGFVTGLYVIFVPILGLLWRQRPGAIPWLGAGVAVVGLYLLCVTQTLALGHGDTLVLLGAICWAVHVLVVGHYSPRVGPLRLAIVQFLVCGCLSLVSATIWETVTWAGLRGAALPLLYGAFFSVGIAFTLQVIAQEDVPPTHTAIILSLETAFAALGGWLLLGEVLSARAILGCLLMFIGIIVSQLDPRGKHPEPPVP